MAFVGAWQLTSDSHQLEGKSLWTLKRMLLWKVKSHLPHPRKDTTLNAPSLPAKSKQPKRQALAKAVVQRMDSITAMA